MDNAYNNINFEFEGVEISSCNLTLSSPFFGLFQEMDPSRIVYSTYFGDVPKNENAQPMKQISGYTSIHFSSEQLPSTATGDCKVIKL